MEKTGKNRFFPGVFPGWSFLANTDWQCIQRVICKARIHTCENVVVSRNNEHNHESNSANFHCSKLKAGIKRSASETQVGPHSIIANSSSLLEEASAVKLPKLNTLKQTVRRERKRVANVPPEPSSLSSLEFPNIYMRTDKGINKTLCIPETLIVKRNYLCQE